MTDILNTLELRPAGSYSGLGKVFEVVVDGKPFLDSVAQFELRYSDRINGAYTHSLGERDVMRSLMNNDCSFMPFACDCGVYECWMFMAKVNFFDDFVYWHQWSNVHRDDKTKKDQGLYWSYKEFPTLCFDRADYIAEVRKAQCFIEGNKTN